jgi:hypothetical protein
VTSWNLREEKITEEKGEEEKSKEKKQKILQSYKRISNKRYIIPPTLC